MTKEELKAIELLKEDIDYRESDLAEYNETKYSNAERTIINLVNKQQKEIEHELNQRKYWRDNFYKQQKEIEVLRKENFDTVYIQAIADYKSKIRKVLQIEGNADIETYLKTIVAENNRLENIEDDRDCNYVSKDKIREVIGTPYPEIAIDNLLKLLEE